MRIRTIKPEFWTHRKTGRLSFSTKCLAIGLLNLADDEGYFEADPILIRSALFPFTEHSLSIHGALNELSEINYIEVRKNEEHRISVGKIVNFLEHQVINRPSASKLKSYHDSGSPHGVFTESSLLEQGREQGTGNRERNGKEPEVPPIIPQGGNSQAHLSEIQERLCDLFNRSYSTRWSPKEIRAFKAIGEIDPDDMEAIERYYKKERRKGNDGCHRRDLCTFLNNFQGEVDRANNQGPTHWQGSKDYSDSDPNYFLK